MIVTRRSITTRSVMSPAPQVLDPVQTGSSIMDITNGFNLLAEDVEKLMHRMNEVERLTREHSPKITAAVEALDDLYSLVDFLEQNPGKDLKDWVRYEAVKDQFRRATGNVGQV